MASGGYGPHGWVVINIDGASYICDPEAQAEIGIYNFYMQPINSRYCSIGGRKELNIYGVQLNGFYVCISAGSSSAVLFCCRLCV